MDGTEHIYTYDEKAELPDEFSWRDAMPPVRNQGMTSTCVCQSLTSVLDFLHNSEHTRKNPIYYQAHTKNPHIVHLRLNLLLLTS